MLFAVVIFLSVVVLGVIAALRFTKGIIPLRTYESTAWTVRKNASGNWRKPGFPEWMKTDSSAFLRHGKAR